MSDQWDNISDSVTVEISDDDEANDRIVQLRKHKVGWARHCRNFLQILTTLFRTMKKLVDYWQIMKNYQ